MDGIVRRSKPIVFRKRRPEKELLYFHPAPKASLGVFGVLSVIPVLFFGLVIWYAADTTSAFSDDDWIKQQRLGSGEWIPELSLIVTPAHPDDEEYADWPCVELASSLEDTTIYYEFSDDGDPRSGGAEYGGGCLDLPKEAQVHVQAIAIHSANDDWRSNVVYREFSIDSEEEDTDETDEDNEKKRKRPHSKRQHHDQDQPEGDDKNGDEKEDREQPFEVSEEMPTKTDLPVESEDSLMPSPASKDENGTGDNGQNDNVSGTEHTPDESLSDAENKEKEPLIKEHSDISDGETASPEEGTAPLTDS